MAQIQVVHWNQMVEHWMWWSQMVEMNAVQVLALVGHAEMRWLLVVGCQGAIWLVLLWVL